MGWSFSCNTSFSKEDQIRSNRIGFSDGFELIDDAVVGNNHWMLVKTPAGVRKIYLTLMKSGYPDHGWGTKDMSEDSGPAEVNCPLRLLKHADAPGSQYASDWRARVQAYHERERERRKKSKALQPGDVVRLSGKSYTLIDNLGANGWKVRCDADGNYFKASNTQISSAIKRDDLITKASMDAEREALAEVKKEANARAEAVQQGFAFMENDQAAETAGISLGLGTNTLVFEE